MTKKKDIEELFNDIIIDISENSKSLISSLSGRMSASTFYGLLKDEVKAKLYACACEDRADKMADEILSIADNGKTDDNVIVQRDRLRIDSRKWLLAKLHPKKYGDKLDVAHTGNITLHFDSEDAHA